MGERSVGKCLSTSMDHNQHRKVFERECYRFEHDDQMMRFLFRHRLQSMLPIFKKEHIDMVALRLLQDRHYDELGLQSTKIYIQSCLFTDQMEEIVNRLVE